MKKSWSQFYLPATIIVQKPWDNVAVVCDWITSTCSFQNNELAPPKSLVIKGEIDAALMEIMEGKVLHSGKFISSWTDYKIICFNYLQVSWVF